MTESQSYRVTDTQGYSVYGWVKFFVPDFNKLPYSLRSQGDNNLMIFKYLKWFAFDKTTISRQCAASLKPFWRLKVKSDPNMTYVWSVTGNLILKFSSYFFMFSINRITEVWSWWNLAFLKMQILHVESNFKSALTGLWEHCVPGMLCWFFIFYHPL